MIQKSSFDLIEATIQQNKFHDYVHFGVRITVGLIFVIHSLGKFEPGFAQNLPNMGLPPEMQIPIALAEFVPGMLLIIGVLCRISASLLSVIMLGAIFLVKGAKSFTGQGGAEFEILLLAVCLGVIVIGPGRVSASHVMKKVPRYLQ